MLWSRGVRILHWSLAAAVVANLFILDGHDDPHKWSGYFALFIVAARFYWGLRKDSGYSRFAEFPLRFHDFKIFFSTVFDRGVHPFKGHNPIAAANHILIWVCVILLAQTGWMLSWDRYFGEEWLEELHAQVSIALEILVVMHLLGVFFDSWKYRRATWLAMIRGRR